MMMEDSQSDLGLPDVEPAVPEPDFFGPEEGGVISISIPPPAASPLADFGMGSQPPENILEDLGTTTVTTVQEVKYDDESCEFNEFLLGAPKNLDTLAKKPADEEEEDKEEDEEPEEELPKHESSDVDNDDEDDEKKETEEPKRSKIRIRSSKSSGSNSPAVVRLSLPKVLIDPKRKISISKESSPSPSSHNDDPPQQSTPSITLSPPRQTRGRLNVSPSSTPASKGKRKVSESEGDSEDEELSVLNKRNITRSGRQTRKIPRLGFEESSKSKAVVSDKEAKRGNRKLGGPATRITRARAGKSGRENRKETFQKSEESSEEDDIRHETTTDSDSASDLFTPVPEKGKYFTDSDGSVTRFTDKSGKTVVFKRTALQLLRLTNYDINVLKEKVVEEETRKSVLLEVCIDNFRSARAAVKGGARRIELCSSLTEGGLTPSIGFLTVVKEKYPDIPVFVMIRPRGGDFVYSPDEIKIMNEDIIQLKKLGADGFVFGVLTEDCEVDEDACQQLVYSAYPSECTFHRAFDKVADPIVALEKVIELQFSRILTSGLADSAKAGIPTLKRLVEAADNRIKIMAGAGVNAGNVAEIIAKTGVNEVHGSASKEVKSFMVAPTPPSARGKGKGKRTSKPIVSMGATDDSVIKVTDSALVAQIVKYARR